MNDGEKRSFKKGENKKISQIPDFMKMDTIKRLNQEQAEYVSEHGVLTAQDILRSADLSLPNVSASPFRKTAQDILGSVNLSLSKKVPDSPFRETADDILKHIDPLQQTPYLSGFYQRHLWTDALRRRIDETHTTEVQALQSDLGPDKASDSFLAEQYNFLLRSTHFQDLARIVNSEEKITLRLEIAPNTNDRSYDYIAQYDPYSHTICIPRINPDGTVKSVEEIREYILWEMSNASLRNQFKRYDEKFPTQQPDQNAPRKEKEIYRYKMAAGALAFEWLEWANIIEHALRCQAINADPNMRAEGPHVGEGYQPALEPDHPWQNFDGYLQEMIEGKHTTHFDPHAADSSWVGKHFLDIVEKRSPDKLEIAQRQVEDWRAGKTEKIKPPSNSPFYSDWLVKNALQRSRVKKVGPGQILGPRENILGEESNDGNE